MSKLILLNKQKNHYEYKCDYCGKIIIRKASAKLKELEDKTRACCNLKEKQKEIGNVYNDMKVIDIIKDKSNFKLKVKCIICGKEKIINKCDLLKAGNLHVSCLKQKTSRKEKIENGIRSNKDFYNKWASMRKRTSEKGKLKKENNCYKNINSDYYKNFETFYNELYEDYIIHLNKFGKKNTTLDRIDPKKNYEKENVRWATIKEQINNLSKLKKFKAIDPDGNIFFGKNQKDFAIKHNLNDKSINACLLKKIKTTKKWKFEYI